jgi:phage tail-like protein
MQQVFDGITTDGGRSLSDIDRRRKMTNGTKSKPGLSNNPLVGYHFQVTFMLKGNEDNTLDIRFQKASGISAQVGSFSVKEGGENLFTHRLPDRISYNNLTLERGLVVGSPMSDDIDAVMNDFSFTGHHVMVSILDKESQPTMSWLFMSAYPAKWSISDLAADQNAVVIDSMELAYTRFKRLK